MSLQSLSPPATDRCYKYLCMPFIALFLSLLQERTTKHGSHVQQHVAWRERVVVMRAGADGGHSRTAWQCLVAAVGGRPRYGSLSWMNAVPGPQGA